MKPIARVALLLATLFVLPAAVVAQTIPVTFTPNPAPAGANVTMAFYMFTPGCNELRVDAITRTGNAIRVDYALFMPGGVVCIGTPPPPPPVTIALGGFPPGEYTATAFGTDLTAQVQLPVVSGTFGVVASAGVPLADPLVLAALALVLLATGMVMRRRATRTR